MTRKNLHPTDSHSARPIRDSLLGALLTLVGVSSLVAQQPNIIHIMVDDAGTGDFTSYFQNSPVQTPNLDALAADGLKFTNAYAGAVSCAPSRSVLLTGYHGGHTYLRSNNGSVSLRDRDVTIAEVLKTSGYATSGYGKWGVGQPGSPGAPELQGFDEFVGYYDQVHAHYHHPDRIYDTGFPLPIPENEGFNEPETGLVSDSRVHAHTIIYDRMKSFIKSSIEQDQPFYSWGAWTPPHRRSTLAQAEANPGGLYDIYHSVHPGWSERAKIQAAYVTWIDQQVGDLRATLADPNGDGDTSDSVAENTLLIFTSDNGGWDGGHPWDRNAETVNGQTVDLRREKEDSHEGGLRVPMIAYWPGTIAPGTQSDHITTFSDFMPTFADLAGATAGLPSDIDGISLAPTLRGVGTQAEHEGIYFEDYSYDDNRSTPQVAVRMGDWKLIRNHNGGQELYNLASDPEESSNQINNPAFLTQKNQLIAFMNDNHTPITAQFTLDPPNVGTGNAARDGMIAHGIRPSDHLNRDWNIAESGDALSLTGDLLNDQGEAVLLFLDDFHQDYQLEFSADRLTGASPTLHVELRGASGTPYYFGSYDTAEQAMGTSDVVLDLQVTGTSPNKNTLASDINSGLTLRVFHDGSLGEVSIGSIELVGPDPIGPIAGDINGDGLLDLQDWDVLRTNLFGEFSQLSLAQAFRQGDLNGDRLANELDYELFKSAYDAAHGMGALAREISVPEPATLPLVLLSLGLLHSVFWPGRGSRGVE